MDVNNDLFFDRMLEPWNEGNFSSLDEYFHPDFQFYAPEFPEVQNIEMFKEWVSMTRVAYPDFYVEITDKMICADKVAMQWHLTGMNEGLLMGQIPATHQYVELSGATVFHFVENKVHTIWWFYDRLSLFQQLGLVPEMEMAPA